MESWKGLNQLPPEEQIALSKSELLLCTIVINNPTIRRFTKNFLNRVPEEFWKVPSSSTGKYHPPEDQGPGGLARHVIKAVEVGKQYARRDCFTPTEFDQTISAIILHDTFKNGIPWGNNTDNTHGSIAADQILTSSLRLNSRDRETISNAVRYHMAPWHYAIDPYSKDTFSREELMLCLTQLRRALRSHSIIEVAVREADYWASRPNMSFMPNFVAQDINFRHDSPPVQDKQSL